MYSRYSSYWNKNKNKIFKIKYNFTNGFKNCLSRHVKKLIKQFSKDKHLLCDSDLERMFNLV